jgi:ubiquitin
MQLNAMTTVADGVFTAKINITNFTSAEKLQGEEFGPISVNLGGVFAAAAGSGTPPVPPAINFALEPINQVIDPTSAMDFNYSRNFIVGPDTPYPDLAAACFCNTNVINITNAVTAWKALTTVSLINSSVVI